MCNIFKNNSYIDFTEVIEEMKYVTVSLGNIFVITAVCAGKFKCNDIGWCASQQVRALFPCQEVCGFESYC